MPRASTFSAVIAALVTAVATGARGQAQEPVSILVEGSNPLHERNRFLRARASSSPGGAQRAAGRADTHLLDFGGGPSSFDARATLGRPPRRTIVDPRCRRRIVRGRGRRARTDYGGRHHPDAVRVSPNAGPAETIVPAASAEEPTPPLLVAPATTEKWHVSVGIEPSVTARVAPQPLYGLPIFIELASPSPSLLSPSFELGFERRSTRPPNTRWATRSSTWWKDFSGHRGSPTPRRRMRLGPCLRFDAGVLQAAGKSGKSLGERTARSEPGARSGCWAAPPTGSPARCS